MPETPESPRRLESFGADTSRQVKKIQDAQLEMRSDLAHQDERDQKQKEHNDTLMFRVTFFGVLVSVITTGAAIWATYEAHLTRIEDERPYIRISSVTEPYSPIAPYAAPAEKRWDPTISISVLGKSPAIDIVVEYYCGYADQPEHRSVPTIETMLFPAESRSSQCKNTLNIKSDGTNKVFKFVGKVDYKDTSGHKYRTPFCYSVLDSFYSAELKQCSLEDAFE